MSQRSKAGAILYDVEGHQLGRVVDVRGQYVKVGARNQPEYWIRGVSLRPKSGGHLVVASDAERYVAPESR